MAADASCPWVFRAFVGRTTEGAWIHQLNQQREVRCLYYDSIPFPNHKPHTYIYVPPNNQEIMKAFCNTTCGQTYTATLTARRRGCTPPTPRGAGPALVPDGPTAFPTNYPGLRLGCVMDAADGQFCAVKMGAPQAGDCHFYKSCESSRDGAVVDLEGPLLLCWIHRCRLMSCSNVHQCSPYHHIQ